MDTIIKESEIKEILSTLPKTGTSAKLEALLAKKEYRDTHPHKLMDEYEAMRALAVLATFLCAAVKYIIQG